jgi:A/G-specific adenine glycosylase
MIPNLPTAKQIQEFQKKILTWYKKNERDLPWRHDRNVYHILLSEIMLQQTQVLRVIPKYEAWLKRFPDFATLASAPKRDILFFWSGLGYNKRAFYLQKCAQIVLAVYAGEMPQDEKILQTFPGIGEYTANALLCFAFDKQVAVIDTNIKKVIAVHFFHGSIPEKQILQHVATCLLPQGKAYTWNQALMDFASAEMKKEKIPIPKQTKFKDSDRYYRGQIIKLLLSNQQYTFEEFLVHLRQPIVRMKKILSGLERDQMVTQKGIYYILREDTAK